MAISTDRNDLERAFDAWFKVIYRARGFISSHDEMRTAFFAGAELSKQFGPKERQDTERLDWLQSQAAKGWADGFALLPLDSGALYPRPWRKKLEAECNPDLKTGAWLWQKDLRTAIDEGMRRDQSDATQESNECHFDADKIGDVLRREAQERSDELGHTIARGVRRLKQLADLRVPPYDLPADSFLEDAVRDILSLRIKHDYRRNREPR